MQIYVVFPKVKIIYFATSAPLFDEYNRNTTTHTVSRSAIVFQAEKVAPMLDRKIRVNDGIGVSEMVTSTQDKKYGKPSKKSKMWQALSDEDDS